MFEKLFQGQDKTPEMILTELLTKNDIEMKTEIAQPINLTKLFIIGECLKVANLPISGKLIHAFIDKLNLFYVSHDRMSRREIIEGLKVLNTNPTEPKEIIG